MTHMLHLTRRDVLRAAPAIVAAVMSQRSGAKPRLSIGACDWSLGARGDTKALHVARELGLDGVQVSMGSVANDLHLRRPEVQQAYRETSVATAVAVGGVALDVMNQVPYKSDPRAEQWVADAVTVARNLGVKVVLLAFFERGDLRDDAAGQAEVIRRLKTVAPAAERAGVVLGIESWLSADDHVRLLDAIGSPAVQVYYDVANSTQMGYDVPAEIRALGRARICEFHAKENGNLLGHGKIDFTAIRAAIDDIGYSGWLQIEGAVPKGSPLLDSHRENVRFMRKHFAG